MLPCIFIIVFSSPEIVMSEAEVKSLSDPSKFPQLISWESSTRNHMPECLAYSPPLSVLPHSFNFQMERREGEGKQYWI